VTIVALVLRRRYGDHRAIYGVRVPLGCPDFGSGRFNAGNRQKFTFLATAIGRPSLVAIRVFVSLPRGNRRFFVPRLAGGPRPP